MHASLLSRKTAPGGHEQHGSQLRALSSWGHHPRPRYCLGSSRGAGPVGQLSVCAQFVMLNLRDDLTPASCTLPSVTATSRTMLSSSSADHEKETALPSGVMMKYGTDEENQAPGASIPLQTIFGIPVTVLRWVRSSTCAHQHRMSRLSKIIRCQRTSFTVPGPVFITAVRESPFDAVHLTCMTQLPLSRTPA